MIVCERYLRPLLARVQKPARYVGGEWNSIVSDWEDACVKLALAYPDTYEIGMSNQGLAILYDLVNRHPAFLAERVYAPWVDMEDAMREAGVPLYSLETRHSLNAFDVIGFSLQHELNYSNVLNMLDLGGMPVFQHERGEDDPLVIAGGSCTLNPAPMADFIDAFVIGEGEQVLIELLDVVRDMRAHAGEPGTRAAMLRRLANIPGVYVPSLYAIEYADDGALIAISPTREGVPERVLKRIIPQLGPAPTHPIVPNMRTVHDRAQVEIQRGCSRGCRFCQAGMIYRPIRERPVDETLGAIDAIVANTGHEEVSLLSLSSSDHSGVREIVAETLRRHEADGIAISLPSLRIDSFSIQLAEMISSSRKTGFTFAPEAGSQRLRDVINKGITEEDLMRTAEAAFESGWNRIKLYFMLGLPTETDEDAAEIARLIREIHRMGRRIRGRRVNIGVSLSTFVPKPHTPFQWAPLIDRDIVAQRQRIVRDGARGAGIKISWSAWDDTWLEAILARGDRRLGSVIHRAWRAGARFCAWSEQYAPELWRQALAAEGLDADKLVARERQHHEVLPWQPIDVGVTQAFLWREYRNALEGRLAPDCRRTCHGCGIRAAYAADHAIAQAAGHWGCP